MAGTALGPLGIEEISPKHISNVFQKGGGNNTLVKTCQTPDVGL